MDIDTPAPDISDIETALEKLTLYPNNISQANTAINLLASASRTHPSTREKLAEPKVLEILIQVIECSINDSIETVEVALRCLGNACIDNDDAKEELTKRGFGWAKLCLPSIHLGEDGEVASVSTATDEAIGVLTMKVLYNICSDNLLAQQRCFDERIHYPLIQFFDHEPPRLTSAPETALFVELLFGICSHLEPEQDKAPAHVMKSLFNLPNLYKNALDTEDFALLIETCLLFLREATVQRDVVEQKCLHSVWTMLDINEGNITRLRSDDLDGRRVLVPLSTGVIWVLSDIAAMPEFAGNYSLDDDFMQQVVLPTIVLGDGSVSNSRTPRHVDAACQILGNLLWARKEPIHLEEIEPLQRPLATCLTMSEDAELLHSAAGLLVQLCRLSAELREVLGRDASTQDIVARLCGHEMPQLKQDGIALLRTLGKDSPANQERFADLAKSVMSSIPINETAIVAT